MNEMKSQSSACHQKEFEKVMNNWMKHSHFYSYSYLLLPTYLGNLSNTPSVKKMNQYSTVYIQYLTFRKT